MTFADLPAALDWLDGHIDYESSMPSRRSLPTLEHIRRLMELLGDPHEAYPSVHVTGTNGKGSTTAMTSALFGARGLRVGTYTSPNLHRVNERIALDGEAIDDESFIEVLESLARLEQMTGDRPTRFELLTAAAFAWFADEGVDAAVIEVGLGGRWDCTNVVRSEVAVLTNVSFDHTEVLGPTLEDIARDKSGIFKQGSRVVIGETDPTLVAQLHQAAGEAGAVETWVRGAEFACTANRMAVGGRLVDIRTPGAGYGELLLPLHGAHQGENAACAVAAAEAFFGAPLAEGLVDLALSEVRIPGRLEVIGRHPLVVIDGAHNVAGMIALARSLVEELEVPGDTDAVVGMLTGRDPTSMLEALLTAGVRSVVACSPRSPRALPADVVGAAGSELGMAISVVPDPADAVSRAMEGAGPDDRIVVCGSMYVVADARALLAPDRT